jgi:hypothetical protein
MSNLTKFDNTIEEFNTEVGKLKEVSAAYQKLKELIGEFNAISKQFGENSEKLSGIVAQIREGQIRVDQGIANLLIANKQGKLEVGKALDDKLEILRKENKEFYKELESTIKIKLDDNRSQIRQLIEGERSRIKDIFEIEFAKNTLELKKTIEAETEKQTKQLLSGQQVIKYSLWFIGGLILALAVINTFKLLR